jgi:putative Mg2+ transporter-C (MgtC) family protein
MYRVSLRPRLLSPGRNRSATRRTRIRPMRPGNLPPMPLEVQFDALLRLVLAGIAGGILGLERETQDKPAGVRTFAVVAIGACVFTLVGELAFEGKDDAVSRLVAQIVTGIGFLGAGTIIQVKDRVEGLTTAAGIWSVAAIGMAFGFGLYVLGIGTTALLLIAFAVIGRLLPNKARTDA